MIELVHPVAATLHDSIYLTTSLDGGINSPPVQENANVPGLTGDCGCGGGCGGCAKFNLRSFIMTHKEMMILGVIVLVILGVWYYNKSNTTTAA